ncbi:MAG TPA: 6-carboxytetrahydropterin synthase [Bacteroidales bacterium]|nr:6-carboxytetrahydropterin synthase [Bacteroidales bacterium]
MKYIITKEFRFEAAHRLLKNYSGKCTNNHGHSWMVKLHLEGTNLDEKDMLIDFQELKALKTWVDDKLDHATLLWEDDPMREYIQSSGQRMFLTKKNPTSEHIAEVILTEAIRLFENSRIKVACVEVNETCTTGAKIYP